MSEEEIRGLLERVEKATGPDREIDVRVHAELVEHRDVIERDTWVIGRNRNAPHDECVLGRIDPGKHSRNFSPAYSKPEQPDYTASIDTALALVERMLPEHDWIIGHTNGGLTIHCQLGRNDNAFGDTAPLAILAALLKALLPTPDQGQ